VNHKLHFASAKTSAKERQNTQEAVESKGAPEIQDAVEIDAPLQFVDAPRRFLYDELQRAVSSVG
jgi:hypothetical protein